jgi:hypothetical protein
MLSRPYMVKNSQVAAAPGARRREGFRNVSAGAMEPRVAWGLTRSRGGDRCGRRQTRAHRDAGLVRGWEERGS